MKWFALAGTALFLAATAAFGGLAEAPAADVPTIAVGETFERPDLTLTVEGAGLSDSAWAEPDDPERQLFVDVAATNLDAAYITSSSDGALRPVAIEGHDDLTFPRMTRPGESRTAILQPLVPTTVRITWEVPREAFKAGDTIRIMLPNAAPRQMFTQSATVWDITPGAYVDVVLQDIGPEE